MIQGLGWQNSRAIDLWNVPICARWSLFIVGQTYLLETHTEAHPRQTLSHFTQSVKVHLTDSFTSTESLQTRSRKEPEDDLPYASLHRRVSHSEVQPWYRSEWKEGWPRLSPSAQVTDTSELHLCAFLSSDTNCFAATSADERNEVMGGEGGTIRPIRVESRPRSLPKDATLSSRRQRLSSPSGEPTLKMMKSIFHYYALWQRFQNMTRGGWSRNRWIECFGDLPHRRINI